MTNATTDPFNNGAPLDPLDNLHPRAPTPELASMRPSDQAEKIAPVQGWPAGIPWSLHMDAYAAYSKKWRPQPALIEGGCRGGFHVDELDELIPGWREKVSEIGKLRAEVKRLQAEVAQAGLCVPGQRVASDAKLSDDLMLIRSVLRGYPSSFARADALAAVDRLAAMTPEKDVAGLLPSSEGAVDKGDPIAHVREAVEKDLTVYRKVAASRKHPDDVAVDEFAEIMKVKLAAARARGREGWQHCQPETLSRMLREHVDKGDPRDVANFAMFLWFCGGRITPLAAPGAAIAARERRITEAEAGTALIRAMDDLGLNKSLRADIVAAYVRHIAALASRQEAPVASGEPTDEEILALNAGERLFSESPSRYPEEGFGTQYHTGKPGLLQFAREVLAFASPPGAGLDGAVASSEAVEQPEFFTVFALYEGGGETGWIALPGYSNETEHGVKNLVLEAARKEGYKGTVTGRLQELGWEIRPVYATPSAALASQPGCAVEGEAVAGDNQPCPFCGNAVDPEGWLGSDPDGSNERRGPECSECGATTESVEAWNRRTASQDTALLDFMQLHRVAVIPEFEGPWDAEIYGEDESPSARGSGNTPREAIQAARAALQVNSTEMSDGGVA